jgi:hypothetical protein
MRQKQKAKLAFRGIEISLEMHIWIQKAQALRKTAKDIIDGIYQQGKKDHMSNANMLVIIHGVFSDYSARHLRTITPPELKNIKMVRAQTKKKSTEIAAVAKSDTSANPDRIDSGPEQKKQGTAYEVKMDLEYTKMLKLKDYDQFWQRFDDATFTATEYGDDIHVTVLLPVTIKVRPQEETARVEIDKEMLNKLMREKQKK